MGGSKSTTTVTYPPPTPEEIELRRLQADALRRQQEFFEAQSPLFAQQRQLLERELALSNQLMTQQERALAAQQQVQSLIAQRQQALSNGDWATASALENQIAQLPGGPGELFQDVLFRQAMAMSKGELPPVSPEGQRRIDEIVSGFRSEGEADIARARENAQRTFREVTAARGLLPSDTPAAATMGPVEAELARQQALLGRQAGALAAQTRLNLATGLQGQVGSLAAFRQGLTQAAEQNRQTLLANLGGAGGVGFSNQLAFGQALGTPLAGYNQLASALQMQRLQSPTTTQTTSQGFLQTLIPLLGSVGQALTGFGRAAPFLGLGKGRGQLAEVVWM